MFSLHVFLSQTTKPQGPGGAGHAPRGAEPRQAEELNFQFDDDYQELGGKKHDFSESPWETSRCGISTGSPKFHCLPSSPKYQPPITIRTCTHAHRSTASTDDEMDDQQVQKLLIVTQTSTTVVSAAYKKHPGGDRTGNFVTRSKMDSDLAQAINDGLYFYEQVLYIIHMFLNER